MAGKRRNIHSLWADSRLRSEFEVYCIGPCGASICTSMTVIEAQWRLNMDYPTGIQSKWKFAKREDFYDGQSNPCSCEQKPKTHKHMLFHC